MRVKIGGEHQTLPVRWFFLPDDAPIFEGETYFRSRNWDGESDKKDRVLGEVLGAPRPWRDGSDFAKQIGLGMTGDPDWAKTGVPFVECGGDEVDYRQINSEWFRATTFVVYRSGNSPPSAPDVSLTNGLVFSAFYQRVESGEGDTAAGHFSHILHCLQSTDVRDDYDEGTPGANYDTVYIPDENGCAFVVRFTEIFKDIDGITKRRVYLDRKAPLWPYDGA